LIGAITKSAQLGFHGWLPDAMEGPTPVSALIHAATMVTAGVFLIIRCSYLFEFSPICLKLLTYISALTIVLFGFVGLAQYDIKKIIAYSTCSQLGYMMLACSLSGYNIALYHLFTHASFKALLFLSAGSIIHAMNNEQDLRKLSGIYNTMPLVSILFLIGSLSLIGFPFLSGFYSKDAIIELSFYYYENPIIFVMTLIGVFLTAMYSFKILYFLFFKDNFNYRSNYNVLDNYSFNYFNFIPLIILGILSMFGGYFTKVIFLGIGNNVFYGNIFVLMKDDVVHSEFVVFLIKLLPIFVILSAFFIFYDSYYNVFRSDENIYFMNYNLFLFFNKRMFFDSLINLFIGFFFFRMSFKIFFIFDKGILEIFGPYGISIILIKLKENLYLNLHSGYLQNIVFHIFFLVLIIFIFCIYIFFQLKF
jgi:NADH-ubiquinone oxidoreductase chain 5